MRRQDVMNKFPKGEGRVEMKYRMRGTVAAVASAVLAGFALVVATPASANGTAESFTVVQVDGKNEEVGSGLGSQSWAVRTSGGCANANASHYIIRLSGGGLRAPINLSGLQPLSAIPALPTGTAAMTIQVPTNLDDAIGRGVRLPGVFDVSVICRAAFSGAALATFSGKITLSETSAGIAWQDGAKPTAVTNSVKPKITGQAKVGSTLTASTGTWTPASAKATVSWKVDGKEVGKGPKYKVKASDRGKTLVAEVTATAPGLAPGKATASVRIK